MVVQMLVLDESLSRAMTPIDLPGTESSPAQGTCAVIKTWLPWVEVIHLTTHTGYNLIVLMMARYEYDK